MDKVAILSIDQGTTSSRAIAFSLDGNPIAVSQREFTQYYPDNGWVEHDPEEIWSTVQSVVSDVIEQTKALGFTLASIGITNQRETTLIWERDTGKPIYNAIVWQDRRTAAFCEQMRQHESLIHQKTGLVLDPYFSASKISWILDNVPDARAQAESGKLAFGTIDTFLIWRLTNGAMHATDATNASRTSLYNIVENCWDRDLLDLFNVPMQVLPEVKNSADDFGNTNADEIGMSLPINGVAGDQQAALFGQCCFEQGDVKSTYGTGCFALMNTGQKPLISNHKLLTTIGYQLNDTTTYALEGAIFTAGANVQWLRDSLNVIKKAKHTEKYAQTLNDDHGVVLVPGFAGLGAPHWEPNARASLFGMTRDTTAAHLSRAALEAVCYQTDDLIKSMRLDGATLNSMWVDGGMVANDWLCQFLSDILNISVNRPSMMESTALGAAYLAALQQGLFSNFEEIRQNKQLERCFQPSMDESVRKRLLKRWRIAVEATLHFAAE